MATDPTLSTNHKRPLHIVIRRLLVSSVLFWIPMVIFLALADEIREKDPLPGDTGLLNAIREFSNPFLDFVMIALTEFGGAPVVISILSAVLIYLFTTQRRRSALFLLLCAGGTALINLLFKVIFQRDRPDLWQHLVTEDSYSFPSGHAMISSAIAFSIIVLAWNTRYRWLAIIGGSLYMLVIGISRLYLGVHFPSDIVGGWSVSLLWVFLVWTCFKRFTPQKVKTK